MSNGFRNSPHGGSLISEGPDRSRRRSPKRKDPVSPDPESWVESVVWVIGIETLWALSPVPQSRVVPFFFSFRKIIGAVVHEGWYGDFLLSS